MKMEKARTLIKQVLELADQRGLLPQYGNLDGLEFTTALALWNELAKVQDIRLKLNHILNIVSYAEALNLMAAVLAQWPAD